jgi:hypothetical protein
MAVVPLHLLIPNDYMERVLTTLKPHFLDLQSLISPIGYPRTLFFGFTVVNKLYWLP